MPLVVFVACVFYEFICVPIMLERLLQQEMVDCWYVVLEVKLVVAGDIRWRLTKLAGK